MSDKYLPYYFVRNNYDNFYRLIIGGILHEK